jgi:hypothetical protein
MEANKLTIKLDCRFNQSIKQYRLFHVTKHFYCYFQTLHVSIEMVIVDCNVYRLKIRIQMLC